MILEMCRCHLHDLNCLVISARSGRSRPLKRRWACLCRVAMRLVCCVLSAAGLQIAQAAPVARQTAEQAEALVQTQATATPQNAAAPNAVVAESQESQERRVQTSFRIRIEAPSDIRNLVERYLELKRYQQVPDLDDVELHRLLDLAEVQIRRLLATQGYFAPQMDLVLRTSHLPANSISGTALPEVVITIAPGERTHIGQLDLQVQGAAQNYVPARPQLERARLNWPLPVGAAFTQAAWTQAKVQMLQSLQAERFAAAKLVSSKASVDPDASSAHLQLLYDSGPVYRYGEVKVQGAKRYDAVIAQRFARLPIGAEYSQSELAQAQQRLIASGYYEGASVMVDTGEQVNPEAAPVLVNVKELPLQKLVLGVGFNTDSGPGVSIEHTHNRLPGLGWRALSKLQWNREKQVASVSLLAPPSASLWQWLLNASYNREQPGSTRKTTQQLRWGRTKNSGEFERTWYVQYDHSKAEYGRVVERDARAASVNYAWTLRRFNSNTFPTSGYGIMLEAGGGYILNPQREPFVRGVARYEGFLSLDRDLKSGLRQALPGGALRQQAKSAQEPSAPAQQAAADVAQALTPRKNGELVARLELGALRTHNHAVVPPNLLFLAGGNTSVRGYGYQQIGVINAQGVTEPGRYMFAGSLEYRRPVWRNGRATDWDSVVFVDAGNVADKPAALRHLRYGVGAGAIWRSPVGPVQLALAYGLKERKVRLHMNLGFSF